jgi:cytochrome P450
MTEATTPVTLPTERETPFDAPAGLRPLADLAPVHRMRYADGKLGWLVTGYDEARGVLDDQRFSNRMDAGASPPIKELSYDGKLPAAPPGYFLAMDDPEHARYRRLVIGQFTTRRMQQLEPRITKIVQEHLDQMARSGPPVDLVQAFALPVPSLVICELLGVPYADRQRFQSATRTAVNLDLEPQERAKGAADIMAYLADLVASKRAEPGDDLLSWLVAGGQLSDQELTGMGLLLLTAGHETTANMIGLGAFLLLRHPDQAAALRQDPGLADHAVEELLRYLTIAHIGPMRVAKADVELAGHTIRAGETVMLSLPVINRDPERFPDPDRLDLTRTAGSHLAFGHGIHQCLGQQLARAELRIAYPALLRRFPTLRLAVPVEEVPLRIRATIYGVHRLPVTW